MSASWRGSSSSGGRGIDPLSQFIYGRSLEKSLFISSQENDLHGPSKLFEESSRVDVVDITETVATVRRDLGDPDEIKAWLAAPPKPGASARFLFLDSIVDAPDRLPVTEEIITEIFHRFGVSSRFFDLLSRQHMPGRQIHQHADKGQRQTSPFRHEVWWSAVLRSQVQPGVLGPGATSQGATSAERAQDLSRDLSRNVAYWQRFALWSDYTVAAPDDDGPGVATATTTYLVLRLPAKLKRDFLDAVEAGTAGVMLDHPLGAHAYFMEHIVRETYDMAASFSVPLYQWENFAEMSTPEDYTRRSRAFLTLSRQIHQISTDHDILTAGVAQLAAEAAWFSGLDRRLPGPAAALQSTVDDVFANLAKEVGLISTYMRLYQERSRIGVSECYALINQRDSEVNIKMGAESAAMTRASVKDNESLRAIQIMSMFFLPGSFVASIFGMGFFTTDISDGGSAVFAASGSWWIYFAVAVPLTAVIVLGMQLWPRVQERFSGGRRGRLPCSETDAEIAAIVRRAASNKT